MPSAKGNVSIHIDPELHKRFKRVAIFRGKTIAEELTMVLSEHCDNFENRHQSAVERAAALQAKLDALMAEVQAAEQEDA